MQKYNFSNYDVTFSMQDVLESYLKEKYAVQRLVEFYDIFMRCFF